MDRLFTYLHATRALLTLGTLALCASSASALTLVGSDLIQPVLADSLDALAKAEGFSVRYQMEGSQVGLQSLNDGRADVAIVALPRGEQPKTDAEVTAWAFLVTVVAVHKDNPVAELDRDDLLAIYSQAGGAINWDRFTREPGWTARKISQHQVRGKNTLGLEVFKVEVLGDQEMNASVRTYGTLEEFSRETRDDFNVITIVPSLTLPASLRALPVAGQGQERPVAPTPENVVYGTYALQLPFYLVYRREYAATPEGKVVLRNLLGNQMAGQLEQADLMPLTPSERQERLRRFE